MANTLKYSKATAVFIADRVEEGMSLKVIHEKYPEIPAPKTIWTWKKKYPEFRELMNLAYNQQLINQLEEINELSTELLTIDKDIEAAIIKAESLGGDAYKEASAFIKAKLMVMRDRRDNIRVRIDTIKFNISHVATKLVPELKEQPKALVNLPSIQIINYSDAKEKEDKRRLLEG